MVKKKTFPRPPKNFWKLLGPSFLILATGIGSGEIVLWPLIASDYGMGLLWLAVIGITFQYFVNMEIERYSLVKGESIFYGLNKLFSWAPYWLIFSTFLTFAIPGTAAASSPAPRDRGSRGRRRVSDRAVRARASSDPT